MKKRKEKKSKEKKRKKGGKRKKKRRKKERTKERKKEKIQNTKHNTHTHTHTHTLTGLRVGTVSQHAMSSCTRPSLVYGGRGRRSPLLTERATADNSTARREEGKDVD